MINSMWNGISGLDSYTKALNSESNNISNVNTIAYKSDSTSFADMLYQDGLGSGVELDQINKKFTQGNLNITSNPYDMAIVGAGFFTVTDTINNSTYYTRAGNFRMGDDGILKTANGEQVMGLATGAPTVVSSNASISTFGSTHTNSLATQTISSDDAIVTINAQSTDYQTTATASGTSGAGYKTASAKISDIEALVTEYQSRLSTYSTNIIAGTSSTAQVSSATFTPASISETSDNISIYIDGTKYLQAFDTDAETTLNKLSDQISNIKGFTSSVDTTTGELTVTSLIPGQLVTVDNAQINDTNMSTSTITSAISGTGLAAVNSARDALQTAIEAANAEFIEITNSIDLSNQNTLTLTSMQLKLDSLNISEDSFGDISVDNGEIYIKQGDNKFIVGKVITSIFTDNLSLEPQGNNLFAKTATSGDAVYVEGVNSIRGETLELSNSSLSEGLVNLILYQKSFEANSKSITTSDDLLKTAIQLKK